MRWAIMRHAEHWHDVKHYSRGFFMAEPGIGAWTDILENIYWFDDEDAAMFRNITRSSKVISETDVLALLVAREFTPED